MPSSLTLPPAVLQPFFHPINHFKCVRKVSSAAADRYSLRHPFHVIPSVNGKALILPLCLVNRMGNCPYHHMSGPVSPVLQLVLEKRRDACYVTAFALHALEVNCLCCHQRPLIHTLHGWILFADFVIHTVKLQLRLCNLHIMSYLPIQHYKKV